MPVSIVVGGQFGSEGKGKVALEIARRSQEAIAVVRVGGPNSGHTAYDAKGIKHALRQLPAACVDGNVDVVLPAGSYIDVGIFLQEIKDLRFPEDRILVHRNARVITPEHREWERAAGLASAIGSTGSGVGGAIMASVAREAANFDLPCVMAEDDANLAPFVCDVSRYLRQSLNDGKRVVVEGTQGYGLSLLDGGYWPKSTSRSTTAAGALSEAGLSPLDVDDVTIVIRSFPIRVAGDSGPLVGEMTWKEIAKQAKRGEDLSEYTTATKRLRRVGRFDPVLVRHALAANRPTRLVMNHLDYVGEERDLDNPRSRLRKFISTVEIDIGQRVDWFGFSGRSILERKAQ